MSVRPSSAIANTRHVLAAPVANGSTFTVPYPAGVDQDTLTGTTEGQLALKSGQVYQQVEGEIAISFGASDITITNDTGAPLPAGDYYLSFGEVDINGSYNLTTPRQIQDAYYAGDGDGGGAG